jgi:aspartyl/asparaginyl-tRNA synthetase
MRLNTRWLDLRVPANNAIMRIRSGINTLFREALLNEQFLEINTPKILSGESEGGSEVFRLDYFGQVVLYECEVGMIMNIMCLIVL